MLGDEEKAKPYKEKTLEFFKRVEKTDNPIILLEMAQSFLS